MRPRVLFDAGSDSRNGSARDEDEMARSGSCVALDARRSHHLVRVLRLGVGAAVEVFDGRGNCYEATIEAADARACLLRLGQAQSCPVESPLDLTLAQCLSTGERMDWTIEKAVELGVRSIVPLDSTRSQLRLDATRAARKLEHWRHIVESACAQSGRSLLPTLHAIVPLGQFVAMRPADEPKERRFVLDPKAERSLSGAGVTAGSRLVLLVGPESGLADEELQTARAAGFEGLKLGPRVLRTETAGLAAIAALQALAGDF
jgi:16S rRNA (uracil1498-N3)-methyltransferase